MIAGSEWSDTKLVSLPKITKVYSTLPLQNNYLQQYDSNNDIGIYVNTNTE